MYRKGEVIWPLFFVTIQTSAKLTPELQRATPILEVACGEMGVSLACFTRSLHANQQVIGVGLKSNYKNVLCI
jgi:hypothetical protein